MRVALLLAVFNRKEVTEVFLNNIDWDEAESILDVYVLDDGSTDGTAELIGVKFPNVHLTRGSGKKYWAGGMRYLWNAVASRRKSYVGYVLANDDIILEKPLHVHVQEALTACVGYAMRSVYVGTFKDAAGNFSYGLKDLRGMPVIPDGKVQAFSGKMLMNANFIFVPRAVHRVVGGISGWCRHSGGDIDYGFRCVEKGIPLLIGPSYIGTCERNGLPAWANARVPIGKRLKSLFSAKGLSPFEYYRIAMKIRPYTWPLTVLRPILIALMPRLFKHG